MNDLGDKHDNGWANLCGERIAAILRKYRKVMATIRNTENEFGGTRYKGNIIMFVM
jgi:hypothetical protein